MDQNGGVSVDLVLGIKALIGFERSEHKMYILKEFNFYLIIEIKTKQSKR